jgi:hypothetical protein
LYQALTGRLDEDGKIHGRLRLARKMPMDTLYPTMSRRSGDDSNAAPVSFGVRFFRQPGL